MFDSHCHLTSEALRDDFENVVTRAHAAGVTHCLDVADTLDSARAAIIHARAELPIWLRATAGVHPQNALQWNEGAAAELRELASEPEVVAIGEIGLDWIYDEKHPHYPGATRERQTEVFREQLQIARELNLPVVIHNRESDAEILEVVKDFDDVRGVFHCWAGSVEAAQQALELGFFLGFTGLATFKNAENVREVARLCPLDKLLIETDAPYLAPIPHRGKTNEPSFMPFIATKLAEVKGVTTQELAQITTANALALFQPS
ncbi:MAG TPA: TatD family hydrolase [Abditibacteriaceae bacterium]|jgi:TatD DNase family protein